VAHQQFRPALVAVPGCLLCGVDNVGEHDGAEALARNRTQRIVIFPDSTGRKSSVQCITIVGTRIDPSAVVTSISRVEATAARAIPRVNAARSKDA
jgi:hypothetical protein